MALAWVEASGQALVNNLNLRLIAPRAPSPTSATTSPTTTTATACWRPGEDCADAWAASTLTQSQWSVPRCGNSPRRHGEPDRGRSSCPPTWWATAFRPDPGQRQPDRGRGRGRSRSRRPAGGNNANQRYALVIAGGVCLRLVGPLRPGQLLVQQHGHGDGQRAVRGRRPGPDAQPTWRRRTTVEVLEEPAPWSTPRAGSTSRSRAACASSRMGSS